MWAGQSAAVELPDQRRDVSSAAAPWAAFARPSGEDCVKKGTVTLPGVPASAQMAINIRWQYGSGSMSRAHVGTGENPNQDWAHTYDVSLNMGIFPEGVFELQVEDDTILGSFRSQVITVPACPTPPPVAPPPVNPPPADPPATPPTASAPVAKQQFVKGPTSLRKGKRVTLAKTTQQGIAVTWKAAPRKVCRIKAFKIKALKKGTCSLSAKAPAAVGLLPLSQVFTIKIK